jgi:hypothetical protein
VDERHSADRLGQRTGKHAADAAVVQHAGDAADVIEVVVGEHQQGDDVDVQVP